MNKSPFYFLTIYISYVYFKQLNFFCFAIIFCDRSLESVDLDTKATQIIL